MGPLMNSIGRSVIPGIMHNDSKPASGNCLNLDFRTDADLEPTKNRERGKGVGTNRSQQIGDRVSGR